MALTGPSTKKIKADITTHLHLSRDRPNIFIQISKRESSEYEMSLGWLIDHIRLNGIKSKKKTSYTVDLLTLSPKFSLVLRTLSVQMHTSIKINKLIIFW